MICKTTNGNGFSGSLSYIMNKEDAEVLGRNLVLGSSPESIAKQMRFVARSNTNTPVHHVSLSFHKDDQLDNDKIINIADSFMDKAGYNKDRHQWIVVRHHDSDHEHVHILANRVGMDNVTVSAYRNKSLGVVYAKEIEQEFDLVRVQEIKKAKSIKANKNKKLAVKKRIIDRIEDILKTESDIYIFQARMEEAGFDVKLNKSSAGKISGVSFAEKEELQGISPFEAMGDTTFAFKGSQLGKQYSFSKIQARLDYNRERKELEKQEQQRIEQIEKERQEQQRIQAEKERLIQQEIERKKQLDQERQEQQKHLAKQQVTKKPTRPKFKRKSKDLDEELEIDF